MTSTSSDLWERLVPLTTSTWETIRGTSIRCLEFTTSATEGWSTEPDLSSLSEVLAGQILTRVEYTRDYFALQFGDLELMFTHNQQCCEEVTLEEVIGEVRPGEKIASISVVMNDGPYPGDIWTFYRIETDKGECTLRFCSGLSYYSTTVSVMLLNHGGMGEA